jgi:beta-lactam-binding protein with PASTA domain
MHKLIRVPLYTFAFIILGLIFGYLTFKILSFSRTVEVPNLYGKTLLESNKLLSDKGLYVKIEGEDFDSSVPPGNIVKQDVPAGNTVKERRGIKVVISKGPKVRSVPLLVNETLANAESLLIEKRLKIGRVITVHSDLVEKDKILAQNPGADEQASDTITVLVSLGPYEQIFFCPDFKGMSFEQANALIKNMNLKVSPEGSGTIVEAQKPEPGRQLKNGDTIYLKLS